MKKIIMAMLLLAGAAGARAQEQKAVWATITVPQVKCWECRDRLEKAMLREKGPNGDAGILQVKINQGVGQVRIQYLPSRINLPFIQTAIANYGFDADSVQAEPSVYAKLPPKCRRAADGGGPQKGDPCRMGPMD